MRRPTKRQIAVPLVVLLVALAGCTGGGGGDGGDGATLTATPTEDASEDPTSTDTATETPEAGGNAFSFDRHASAVKNAGSYTIEYTIKGLGQSSGSFEGVQKVDTTTGERYATLESSSGGQSFTIEYYSPPNDDTVYQHIAGRTQETSQSQGLINLTSLQTSGTADQAWLSNLRKAGTAKTQLGPATKYVIDSVDQIPNSSVNQYSSLESVNLAIYVDKDTGLIARYDYKLVGVRKGQETTLEFSLRVTKLGSTTIEPPEWAP